MNFIKKFIHSKTFTLICLYLAMILVFTVWAALKDINFLQISIFRNILKSLVIPGFLTLGAGCLLIAGHMDLSQSAAGAFGGMVLATAIKAWSMPWYLAIIVCLAMCAVLGLVNGLLVVKLHFPSFIGTLAMASMIRGLMYLFSSMANVDPSGNHVAANINFVDNTIKYLGTGMVGGPTGIPFNVILLVIAFVGFGLLMSKSAFGMKVTLLGGSPVAATLAGINANAILLILFMLSAVMGGVSGIFQAAQVSQGNLQALTTSQFIGLTAAILGGISFGGGVGGMGGAFIGLLILRTFVVGMGIVGVNPSWVNVFSGLLLLVALSFDFFAQLRQAKKLSH